jgi:hypothetical protein
MSNAPAREFGSTHRPSSGLIHPKGVTVRVWRLASVAIEVAAAELRRRALRRAEQQAAMPAQADRSFSRLHPDVMRVEARHFL